MRKKPETLETVQAHRNALFIEADMARRRISALEAEGLSKENTIRNLNAFINMLVARRGG